MKELSFDNSVSNSLINIQIQNQHNQSRKINRFSIQETNTSKKKHS